MKIIIKVIAFQICLIVGLLSGNVVLAQRTCGTDYQQQYQNADAFTRQRMDAINQQTISYRSSASTSRSSGQIITIPVVVHVVYNTTAENVSNAQIQSQITVLNEDFRFLNADKSNIPTLFSSLAADLELEFVLASVDPNGNFTTGITRTSTTLTSFDYTSSAVKFTSQGGRDAWPSNRYLNLWVCDISGKTLGYSTLPGATAAIDGVVIDFAYLGRGGTAQYPFDKGRTGTHEIGHWLNLSHIWGNNGTSCTDTDEVADTPNQAGSNFDCPSFPHSSCSNTSDMFMNYMDYTNDACMNMFSKGQKDRIDALFASGGARESFLLNNSCVSDFTINQPINASGTYKASNSLTATTTITSNVNVVYQAGNQIALKPGFTINPGSTGSFAAKVASCSASGRLTNEEDDKGLVQETLLLIFPNPTNGKFSLELPSEPTTTITLEVFDSYGRKMLYPSSIKEVNSRLYEINVSNYPSGIYFIRVKHNKEWITKKVFLSK